jgi:hypothetical protein
VVGDLLQVLRREDDCAAALARRVDPLPQPLPLGRIERRRRLVEEEDLRRAEERDREVQALPVADGERAARATAVRKLEGAKERGGRGGRVGLVLQAREELEVLARREAAVERGPLRCPADPRILRPLDRALARVERPGEEREQRRLAGPVRPDERDDLAGRDDEVGRRQGEVAPEAARDATRAQDHRSAAAGGASGSGTAAGPGR